MTDPTPSVSGTDEALVWLAFRAESAGAHPNYAIVSDYLIGMAQQNAALQRELAEARERIEREEADCTQVMKERDWAQDCLQETHIALGGDGEWMGKLPSEAPPDSGDLHYDVPVLAAEVLARAEAAESALADARRDAERYRWLRNIDADGWPAVRVPCPCPDGIPYPRCTTKHTTPKRGEALDAAIDAAIGAPHG